MPRVSSIFLTVAAFAAVSVNALEDALPELDCSAAYPCNDKSQRNPYNCECECLKGAELTCESWEQWNSLDCECLPTCPEQPCRGQYQYEWNPAMCACDCVEDFEENCTEGQLVNYRRCECQ